MDDFIFKLLWLIVPAIFFVVKLLVFPMLEELKFKNSLIGKTITVVVDILDLKKQNVERYITEGTIHKITDVGLVEVKRKTEPIFRIPYEPSQINKSENQDYTTEYYVEIKATEIDKFNKTKGFEKSDNN